MNKRVKKCIKRLVAAVLALALVVLGMFESGTTVYAGEQDRSAEPLKAVKLGNQKKINFGEDVYSYSDAVVRADNIRSVFVAYKNRVSDGNSILLPSDGNGIRFNNGTDTFKAISVDSGTSNTDIQNYIREIKFKLTDDSAEIFIIVSKEPINGSIYYNSSNRHFYQYVSSAAVPWNVARENAKSMKVADRNGYLATVTSSAEEMFLKDTGSGNSGWIGGTRLVYKSSGDTFNYSAQEIYYKDAGTENRYPWYWADGPEKGQIFFSYSARSPKPYSKYTGWLKNYNFNRDVLQIESANIGRYCNFYGIIGSKDRYKEPVNETWFTDSCTVWTNNTGGFCQDETSWKAEPYQTTSYNGYYVEFGDKVTGDTSEENNSNVVTAKVRKMTNVATPYVSIDYINEEITGFSPDMQYKIQAGSEEPVILSGISYIQISSDWFGKDIVIKACGDGIYTADSQAVVVHVPYRQGPPSSIQGYNRTLSNVNSLMEYRKKGTSEWIKITENKVQKLSEGEYEVRYSATSSSFKSAVTVVPVQAYGAVVGINSNKLTDVALSVGTTDVEYNNFEQEIRQKLAEIDPLFDLDSLNIMASDSVDTSGQSSFTWMQFDHSSNSSVYGSNTYIENTGSQADNIYNSNKYHIQSDDNGTKLTFYGYGSSGYADFMLLENEQQTNKKFQFAIKEYFAADALYGTGFFFNSNLSYSSSYGSKESAYNSSALYMNGYLAVLEYNGSSAQGFKVYKFKNLNLKKFHTSTGMSTVYDSLINACQNGTSDISLIASTTNIKASDDLRKFVIDVTPKKITVYYAGFDDTSHTVSNISTQAQADAQKFNPNNQGYKDFVAMTYEKLQNDSSKIILSANLNEKFGGSDFGPMTKYGSHNCSSLTKVELSELSMSMDVVRSLSETLREPKWRDGADKFLINLNEDPINDFDNVSVTAELLNRLKNDSIYYIGWCGNENSAKSADFLNKNDLKGAIVSVDDPAYKNNHEAQVEAIARCIHDRYAQSASTECDVIMLNDNKIVSIGNAEISDSADSQWPEGKWRIDYFDDYREKDDLSIESVSSVWMSDFQCDFDKCGVYKIYYNYEEGDEPVQIISVHDAPLVSIAADVQGNGTSGTGNLSAVVDDSHEAAGKQFTYKWTYKNLGTASNVISNPVAADGGTGSTAIIENMRPGEVYLVTLEVKDDIFGYSVTASRQIMYTGTTTLAKKTPPTAFFSIGQSKIIMKNQNVDLTISDTSYDPSGAPITARTYILYKPDGTKATMSVSQGKYTVSSSMPTGTYTIGLVVESANGKSQEMKRSFDIVNDIQKPQVQFTVEKGVLSLHNNETEMNFSDEGGSGYKGYRYCVSQSADLPDESQWSAFSSGNSRTVTFPMLNGSYYVHYKAEDNAGNVLTGCEGPFVRNQILNTPDNLCFEEGSSPVLTWSEDSRVTAGGKASYTVTVYKDGKNFDEISGLTSNKFIGANIVRGGNGEYAYTVQTVCDGNTDSSEPVKYISGQVSEKSQPFNYVKPVQSEVNGGPLDLSEPVDQNKVDDAFQGHATLTSAEPVEITLDSDINLKETIEISKDIIINLNGHTIKGPDGTADSPDGKPAFEIVSDNVSITLRGSGQVIGGNGYSGPNGGDGGSGIRFKDSQGGNLDLDEDTTVKGGNGGDGALGSGGNGGTGVEGDGLKGKIGGNVEGGDGGSGATSGGDGGSGIDAGQGSNIHAEEGSEIKGGSGGFGETGGNGGSGVEAKDSDIVIDNGSDIEGGTGGDGKSGTGGDGGQGVSSKDTDIDNRGNVKGGDGGTSQEGNGGSGGNAYNTEGGNLNNYDGNTQGGNAGDGNSETTGGKRPEAGKDTNEINKGQGGELNIPQISEDATPQELEQWENEVKSQLDRVFGPNKAAYDPEENRVILYSDVELENPIKVSSDIKIDLNGHTIKGPDGTKENPSGSPAIIVDGDDVSLEIENSSEKEGAVKGGDGYSGTDGAMDGSGENGGDGGNAVDCGNSSGSSVKLGNNIQVSGGDGGNSLNGTGGNGGSAVTGTDVDVDTSADVTGGNGGNGALKGGEGGNAIELGKGSANVEDGTIAGGNGGSGDKGGEGGNAFEYSVGNNTENVTESEDATISGGKSGSSVSGQLSDDGKSRENTYRAPGGTITKPVTQEMLDEIFGPGAAHFDQDSDAIVIEKDINMSDTIIVDDDINIDLNGHKLKGPDGSETEKDARPLIRVERGDIEINITDSTGLGGELTGGDGKDVSGNSEAGAGGNVIEFNPARGGSVTIGEGVKATGGTGGNNTLGAGGTGGNAIVGNDGTNVKINGQAIGGNGGYSGFGTGGAGGNAVTGNRTDIEVNGDAAGGNGGNSGYEPGGAGGNVFDGDGQNIILNGGAKPGKGGTNNNNPENPRNDGGISDRAESVTYNVVRVLDRLVYEGSDVVTTGMMFKAKIASAIENNRYVSLPSFIKLKVNNEEIPVSVYEQEIGEEENFDMAVYSSVNGLIYVPASYITGSVWIKAELYAEPSVSVSSLSELKEAAEADVAEINVTEDIVIDEDIVIGENTEINLGENNLDVAMDTTLENNGKISGNGSVNNSGTVENSGIIESDIRNQGVVSNSQDGDIINLVDLGGQVENQGYINDSHVLVRYYSNNEAGLTDEEQVLETEIYSVRRNMYRNNKKYFIEWNTKADGTGISYKQSQLIDGIQPVELFAIWSEEDGGAKIGDEYFKDLKEALSNSEPEDVIELENDYNVQENLFIPKNVTVDTKGNNITVEKGSKLVNNGEINGAGKSEIGGEGLVENNGVIKNPSKISNTDNNGIVSVDRDNRMKLSGEINNNSKGAINSDGQIDITEKSVLNNKGDIYNSEKGVINNRGDIENTGKIHNEGNINNKGSIDNKNQINSSGNLDNSGKLNNGGNINNKNGIISGSVPMSNSGSITEGEVALNVNNEGGKIEKAVISSGTEVEGGTLDSVTIYGTVKNAKYLCGNIINDGNIVIEAENISVISSVITNRNGIILNNGAIKLDGKIYNQGVIENNGHIIKADRKAIVNGGGQIKDVENQVNRQNIPEVKDTIHDEDNIKPVEELAEEEPDEEEPDEEEPAVEKEPDNNEQITATDENNINILVARYLIIIFAIAGICLSIFTGIKKNIYSLISGMVSMAVIWIAYAFGASTVNLIIAGAMSAAVTAVSAVCYIRRRKI